MNESNLHDSYRSTIRQRAPTSGCQAALQAFALRLGLDLQRRRTGLNQVEREWIVIRYVKTLVYLPAGYLNRAAHERPVYLSPRFEEATRWRGGGWRRTWGVAEACPCQCHCCAVFRDVQVQVVSHYEHALRTVTC